MTSKEYEQRLEALEREIAALKRENVEDGATPKPPHPRWKPVFNETYYLISRDASILSFNWDCGSIDTGLFAAANVYKSEDDAKFAAERWKVLAEIREWAGTWDDLWKLSCDGYRVQVVRDLLKDITYGEMRFATREDAENCIKAVGEDRLKTYYFRIRNNKIPMPDCCCCSY